MSDADLRQRLDALTGAIGHSSVVRLPAGDDTAAADTQRAATTQVDELLRRVAAVTSVLGAGNAREWDEIDQLAARLLMADLAVITSTTRALNGLAAARLTQALADLTAARRDAERSATPWGPASAGPTEPR